MEVNGFTCVKKIAKVYILFTLKLYNNQLSNICIGNVCTMCVQCLQFVFFIGCGWI